jgi:hypothetical protein
MHMDSIGLPARYMDGKGRIDVARIKAETSIAKVAAEATDLKKSGDELKGLCPFHPEETASFFVNEGKQVFHCHGCEAGGDVIELHRRLHHVDFRQACFDLTRAATLVPIAWSLSETYFINRGIGDDIPGSIRHSHVARWWDADGCEGRREPAMIAALQDREGRVAGIQRTFLDHEGRKSTRGTPRLSLGRVRGCAVRFGPVAETVMLAASVEDGLAVRLMFPGASVWAAVGDGNLPHVRFPSEVKRVIVCGDADAPGRAAVAAAIAAYAAAGLAVEDLIPRAGKDFNEEWLLLHA